MANGDLHMISGERRAALAERLWRAAELQAAEIEARIASGPRPPAEAERDAKTLSVLARTLRELSAADAAALAEIDDANADEAPAEDVDALRAALYRQLGGLERARGPGSGGLLAAAE
jgi:hypothetical protein